VLYVVSLSKWLPTEKIGDEHAVAMVGCSSDHQPKLGVLSMKTGDQS
jgi:hypothetical protein